MKVSAKFFVFVMTAILSACVMFGCGDEGGPDAPEGFTVIRFWNGFTGVDGESMDKMVSEFNTEYESQKIRVVADKIPWDTLFTKITTTGSNLRSAPHIVAMSASRIAGMQARNIFTPLDGVEEFIDVSADEYIDTAWTGGILNGVRYGFPIDVHPTAMYYNKDIVSEDELPETWDEFLAVCREKTQNGVYGWAMPSMYSITKEVFLNKLYSAGGTMFDADDKPVFNSTTAAAQLEWMANLIYGVDPVSPKNVGAGGDFTLFTQGKSAFYFDGPWVINTFGLFDNENSNIGVAPCPGTVGEGEKNFAGSHQFTLMKNTVTTDRTRNACYTFMKYISDHSLDWAKAGQVPAKKSIHETEEYKELAALQPFTQMAYTATLSEIDYRYWYEAYNMQGVAVSNALSGIKSAKAALDGAVSDFNAWLIDEAI